MDKLRALQYFGAAADERSLSGAARRFEVSVAAVAKMINALETALGARLFDRTASGLTLTAIGESYLGDCAPALAQLQLAEQTVRASSQRTPGTVVVGVQHVIQSECLTPALPGFLERNPQVQIDLRDFTRFTEEQTRGVDVFLVLGWPKVGDLARRPIASARFIVVAAPAYWAAHGMPRHPSELARHCCFNIRGVDGTVMDLWSFARDGEQVSVPVAGRLVTSNAHRDAAIGMALAGLGVVRILDWTNRAEVARGELVPALLDWESLEAPPLNLLYRPSVRRVPRIRLFLDFAVGVFQALDRERAHPPAAAARPAWLKRPYGRASASVKHGH